MENFGVLDLEVMKKHFFLHKFKAAKTTSKTDRIYFKTCELLVNEIQACSTVQIVYCTIHIEMG